MQRPGFEGFASFVQYVYPSVFPGDRLTSHQQAILAIMYNAAGLR